MFQKLYKNLEEINRHGYDQSRELKQTREAVLKLTEQLTAMTGASAVNGPNTHTKGPNRKLTFQKADLVILSIGLSLLAVMIILTVRFSRDNRKLWQNETVLLNANGRIRDSSFRAAERQDILNEKEFMLEMRISKIDSLLVAEQQTLQELKKLNNTSVRTFIGIRKAMERSGQPVSQIR